MNRDGGGSLRADPPSRGSRPTNAGKGVRQRTSAVFRAALAFVPATFGRARVLELCPRRNR